MRWVFTVPNPGDWRPIYNSSTTSYLVWEMETCPTTGTPHIQGYIRFKTRKLLSAVKNQLHPSAHLELARGSEEENRNYCSKAREQAGSDWAEHGTYDAGRRQGQRSDLISAIETLKESGICAVMDDHPETYCKYHSGLEKLAKHHRLLPPLRREMEVTVVWGPPGIGKTWATLDAFPDAFCVTPGRDPWGHYNHEKQVVFDEFHPEQWNIQDMNRYLDIYRCRLSCRYDDKYAEWNRVIIISNIDPAGWYFQWPEDIRQAFHRRIDNIIHMTERDQIIFTQEME